MFRTLLANILAAGLRADVRPLLLCLCLVLLGGWSLSRRPDPAAAAQAQEPEWSEPVNISRSGGTTNPRLFVTTNGLRHALWDVTFAEAAIASGDAKGWGKASGLAVPFRDRPLVLIPDPAGSVHASWISEDGTLFYRLVPGTGLNSSASWFGARRLATSVVAFDMAVDALNRVHLAFIRVGSSASAAPGVYYLISTPGGGLWSPPTQIYASDYYLRYGEDLAVPSIPFSIETVDMPGVDVDASTDDRTTRVYLSWDNPPFKRAYESRSIDSGLTWSDPETIAGPSSDDPYGIPSAPSTYADRESVLRSWQIIEAGGSCRQMFQASGDFGETWSDPQPGFAGAHACAEDLESFPLGDGVRLFFYTLNDQAYLIAWDGSRWSRPQPQPALDSFMNSETFDLVDLDCRQGAMDEETLVVVACDRGEGGDTWSLERKMSDLADWFGPDTGWTTSAIFLEDDPGDVSLAVAADLSGTTHALWIHRASADGGGEQARQVSHVGLSERGVSGPFVIFPLRDPSSGQLDVAVTGDDRIEAVWTESRPGSVEFSWTGASQADSRSSWYNPIDLDMADLSARWPTILPGEDGQIFVGFTVPVNEERGLYLLESVDGGNTWSEPVTVFDAVSVCEQVGPARFAASGPEVVHALWTCSAQPGGLGPLALYYTRSDDHGLTWTDPFVQVEGPVTWSEIFRLTTGDLMTIWETASEGRRQAFSRISTDGGSTWQEPVTLPTILGEAAPTSAVADGSGQVHLLQLKEGSEGRALLEYRVWGRTSWRLGEGLRLPTVRLEDVRAMAADVDSLGRLVLVLLGRGPLGAGGDRPAVVWLSTLGLGAPGRQPGVVESPTPFASATVAPPAPTSTAPPPVRATPTFSPDVGGGTSGSPLTSGLIAAGLSTAVLLVIVVVQRFRSQRQDEATSASGSSESGPA